MLRQYQQTFGHQAGREQLMQEYTVITRPVDKRKNYIKRCIRPPGEFDTNRGNGSLRQWKPQEPGRRKTVHVSGETTSSDHPIRTRQSGYHRMGATRARSTTWRSPTKKRRRTAEAGQRRFRTEIHRPQSQFPMSFRRDRRHAKSVQLWPDLDSLKGNGRCADGRQPAPVPADYRNVRRQ